SWFSRLKPASTLAGAGASASSLSPQPATSIATTSAALPQSLISTPPQEPAINFSQRKARPRRAAMVALPGTLGDLHVAQQGVHFRQRQPPVGAYRTVAGHRRQQLVTGTGDAPALAMLAQVGEHIAQQPFRLGIGQQRRNAAHMQRARPG